MAYYIKVEENIIKDIIAADQTYLDAVGGEWIEINEQDYFDGLYQIEQQYNG